ncbi:drtgg [Lucifera butyrica]|uniref:inorganic diphosphatase n=1 Tax=Lucifera butyrica TaxID=1351585 RepID=A0A498RBC9_9FIRM|nr:putative manganese-dependent inorganic diphosphatase [Lucifera butyrica]VBB08549.1 drtgg [Lucifera butyrica]
MSKPVYVIGHRNPDTDSICAAIGYAHLKTAMGEDVIPARAGKINAETKYVLDYFGVSAPVLVSDLYPRVKDVMKGTISIHPWNTLRELGNVMKKNKLKSMPVVNDAGTLIGMVSVGDLANRYFEEMEMQDLSSAGIDFEAVLRALGGTLICGSGLSRTVSGYVRIAAAQTSTISDLVQPGDILLVSDREDVQLACIEKNIVCLVITSNANVSVRVREAANERNVIIIQVPYDTYSCARLINQSIPVHMVMQPAVTAFKPTELLTEVKNIIVATNHRNYPVAENGKLIGLIDRDQLIVPQREKIILVDHNERTQAVEGIEEAQIIEIVDHHRLGGLQTGEPIFIRHEPVGSTSTIVASMHWHRAVEMPRHIAGLLLAAIISDTVLFKSPTATETDRQTAEKLAAQVGLDIAEFGMAMLKAGSAFSEMSIAEIVHNDLKEYQIGEYRVAIGQISVMDPNEILSFKSELLDYMELVRNKERYDMVGLMVTDIINEATQLIYTGPGASLLHNVGHSDEPGILYLKGVMSRKKQVVPLMVEAARR